MSRKSAVPPSLLLLALTGLLAGPGRPALAEEGSRQPAPRGATLHVRAEDTGAELDGVELVAAGPAAGVAASHPGWPDQEDLLAAGASPVALPRPQEGEPGGARAYFVRRPGYAWGRIDLDPAQAGEHTLVLAPAGWLDVGFDTLAADVPDGSVLRIRSAADAAKLLLELPVEDGSLILIDSVPPGKYAVALEAGGKAVAAAEVKVVAGARSACKLNLPTPPQESQPAPGR